MPRLTIDPEFKALCPAQSDDELALLRESLCDEGCRDPIIYWETEGKPILDGMTRFALCTESKIPFERKGIKLPSRHVAKCWILRNQLGRRNLSDTQRSIARGKLYNELKASHGGDRKSSAQNAHLIGAAAEIAAKDGVSEATVRRDGKLAEAVEKITPAAAVQIQGTPVADSKTQLEELSHFGPADQQKVARVIGKGEAKTVKDAAKKAKVKPPAKPKSTSGKPKVDLRKFKALEDHIGKAVRMSTEIKQHCGGVSHHETLRAHFNAILKELSAWKKMAGAA